MEILMKSMLVYSLSAAWLAILFPFGCIFMIA